MKIEPLVKVIIEIGQTELNARKLAIAIVEAVQEEAKLPAHVATKEDVKDLEIRMLNEFSKVRSEIQLVIKEMNHLTFRLLGGMFGIIALFKLGEIVLRYKMGV